MSKEAALRAMREARYAERTKTSGAAKAPARPTLQRAKPEVEAPPVSEAAASDELCGHRSMNGRACTREHGHAAKSHRYS